MTVSNHYHCAVKAVGRATGRSSVAASAYRSASKLLDERTGIIHDYSRRHGVHDSFIVARDDAPEWAQDRSSLWNALEASTNAKNGRLATELELALPCELSDEQRRELVENFVRDIVDRHGVVADVAIHSPGRGSDNRNHHAHVMITHRVLEKDGFGEIAGKVVVERKVKGAVKAVEVAGLFNQQDIIPIRKAWEIAENSAYEKAGLDIRVDHRSHKDRGITAEPTKHLGPAATAMERRGEATDRGDINREIKSRNIQRERLENERLSVADAIVDLEAQRQSRSENRDFRAALRTESADRILNEITEKKATFTNADLVRLINPHVNSKEEARALALELLAHPHVIGLRETAADPVNSIHDPRSSGRREADCTRRPRTG